VMVATPRRFVPAGVLPAPNHVLTADPQVRRGLRADSDVRVDPTYLCRGLSGDAERDGGIRQFGSLPGSGRLADRRVARSRSKTPRRRRRAERRPDGLCPGSGPGQRRAAEEKAGPALPDLAERAEGPAQRNGGRRDPGVLIGARELIINSAVVQLAAVVV